MAGIKKEPHGSRRGREFCSKAIDSVFHRHKVSVDEKFSVEAELSQSRSHIF
jgi:hypothetical protein